MTDTEELRRLAEQARDRDFPKDWENFRAAASPDVVLGLLDELRSASGMSGRLVEVTGKLADTEADRDALTAALRWIAGQNPTSGGVTSYRIVVEKARAVFKERSDLAQHVEPAVHMRQSGNGCVVCPRRWSDHTPAERGEPAAVTAQVGQSPLETAEPLDVQIHAIWESTFDRKKAMQDTESHADLIEYAWAEGFKHGRAAAASPLGVPPAGIDGEAIRSIFRERGWVIQQSNGPGAEIDPFAALARLLAESS